MRSAWNTGGRIDDQMKLRCLSDNPWGDGKSRTVANSEACSYADLEKWKFALDADIKFILGELRRDPEKYGWIEQEQE